MVAIVAIVVPRLTDDQRKALVDAVRKVWVGPGTEEEELLIHGDPTAPKPQGVINAQR